jgi:hypothetical protein
MTEPNTQVNSMKIVSLFTISLIVLVAVPTFAKTPKTVGQKHCQKYSFGSRHIENVCNSEWGTGSFIDGQSIIHKTVNKVRKTKYKPKTR